jgi:hypothetical protein
MAILVIRSWDVSCQGASRESGARAWLPELYLETPGRSRPKNELYRRVLASATICSKNWGLN